MNPFRNPVRPHWTPPPDCMSCQEIQFWMRELRRRGWNRGVTQRVLGMGKHSWSKADGKDWIYPSEQMRFSRQLRKIISGEVVMKPTGRKRGGPWGNVQDAVLADNPTPMRMPMKLTFDVKVGRIRMQPYVVVPENPLPSFKTILDKAVKWKV